MDFVHNFDSEVYSVQDACERRIMEYPGPLKEQALSFLTKHNMRKEQNVRSGICYLLPFWLNDLFGIDEQTVKQISLGNAFGILYFLILDEIMDAGPDENKGDLLPLGTIFQLELVSYYRALFPSQTEFWQYYDRFMTEWSQSVLWEKQEHWGKRKPYSEKDLLLISRKAAPLKICAAAMGLLSGRRSCAETLFCAIDYNQIVFQLIDDWRDWHEDLTKRNATLFLTRVMEYCGIDNLSKLTETHVKAAILTGDVLNKVFRYEKKYSKKALELLSEMSVPYFKKYIQSQSEYCRKVLLDIRNERDMYIRGGFNLLFGIHIDNKT